MATFENISLMTGRENIGACVALNFLTDRATATELSNVITHCWPVESLCYPSGGFLLALVPCHENSVCQLWYLMVAPLGHNQL